jgi:hypothetical protein
VPLRNGAYISAMPLSNAERQRSFRRRRSAELADLRQDAADDGLYLMANLRPADTGLPMVVWVSERGRARHDVRVKVATEHGERAAPYRWASVAVRPAPRLVAGRLHAGDLATVSEWIRLNETTIVDYWEGTIGTLELARRLRPLPVE